MVKGIMHRAVAVAAAVLLFGCAGEKVELTVKANLDGKPAAQAKVSVDGKEAGLTDGSGGFTAILERKAGAEVAVAVSKDQPGYHTKPWTTTFVVKPSGSAAGPTSFTAEIPAIPYLTIKVLDRGKPVADALVRVAGKEAGKTGEDGQLAYEHRDPSRGDLAVSVAKPGYAAWTKTLLLEPGATIEAALTRRITVSVTALIDEYGRPAGVAGVSVTINGQQAGKTDAKGNVTWTTEKDFGKKVPVVLSAPGYLPETWTSSVKLDNDLKLQRYFTEAAARPLRTGIYRFVGNTPNADLKEALAQAETALAAQLFKNKCFKEVPHKALLADMKVAKVSIERATSKGWRESQLRRSVDLIVVGSVAQDDKGYLLEAKFYAPGGIQVMSQIARAKGLSDIPSAAKEISAAVVDRFPFEGTVVAADDQRFRINLGKDGYKIGKGTDFIVMTPKRDDTGKVTAYREAGRVRTRKVDDSGSWAEVEELKKDEQVAVGDRVIRRVYREGEEEGGRNTFILSVKGGVAPDVVPLAGVNIYGNNEWLGATGADGKAEVPAKLNTTVALTLYRHGYQQVSEKIKVAASKEQREYVLTVNNALFKLDSQPQGADILVDGEKFGRTPLLAGKPVTLGFHTVKATLGGDYRDWEEVLEFSKREEDRTGERKVMLYRDYLKIGERAEQKGEIDAAIAAYRSADKSHPDYSTAHHRLAQLYLDEKADFDGAIREFENVLSLPENQQLVYKQFAVAFTNLGHAYYEKGNALLEKDRDAAAHNYAEAIKRLQTARQNMRFFPNERYDEAVHDTYYYSALAYHKLYQLTKKGSLLQSANHAWREYFDFFPKSLEGNSTFDQTRSAAEKYWNQIRNL